MHWVLETLSCEQFEPPVVTSHRLVWPWIYLPVWMEHPSRDQKARADLPFLRLLLFYVLGRHCCRRGPIFLTLTTRDRLYAQIEPVQAHSLFSGKPFPTATMCGLPSFYTACSFLYARLRVTFRPTLVRRCGVS